jgi:hypothetical protein
MVGGRHDGGEPSAGVGDRDGGGGAGMKKKEVTDGNKKEQLGGPVVGWKFASLCIFRKPHRIPLHCWSIKRLC